MVTSKKKIQRFLKKLIKIYNLPVFSLLAILGAIGYKYSFNYFISTYKIQEWNSLYSILKCGLAICFLSIWFYLFFTCSRDSKYLFFTGRSYQKDHREFNKSYFELLDFFKTKSDNHKIEVDDLPIKDWHDANEDGVILCKAKDTLGDEHLLSRKSSAPGNIIVFGLPGSGKSTAVGATTAAKFNCHLPGGGCGIFAISIKGDLLNFIKNYCKKNGVKRNIKVFTPDKAEGSCHYNPFYGLDQMDWTERRIFAENMSNIIIPDEEGDNAAYFVTGARDFWVGILLYDLYLHDAGKLEGKSTFPEVIKIILNTSLDRIIEKIKNCGCSVPGEYTNSYDGNNEKNTNAIFNHLTKAVRPFTNGALNTLFDGTGDCISPYDLDNCDIYIDVPQAKYSVYAPAISIITSNFLLAFESRKDISEDASEIPYLFLLDEMIQLSLPFKFLSEAMSTLRSKRVSLMLILQSVAQLEGKYGESHAREIMDLCAYVAVFNAQDPKSRDYFRNLVGTRKMLQSSASNNHGTNYQESSGTSVSIVDEYIFQSADFGNLNIKDKKNGKITKRVLIYADGKYILGETTPCYE